MPLRPHRVLTWLGLALVANLFVMWIVESAIVLAYSVETLRRYREAAMIIGIEPVLLASNETRLSQTSAASLGCYNFFLSLLCLVSFSLTRYSFTHYTWSPLLKTVFIVSYPKGRYAMSTVRLRMKFFLVLAFTFFSLFLLLLFFFTNNSRRVSDPTTSSNPGKTSDTRTSVSLKENIQRLTSSIQLEKILTARNIEPRDIIQTQNEQENENLEDDLLSEAKFFMEEYFDNSPIDNSVTNYLQKVGGVFLIQEHNSGTTISELNCTKNLCKAIFAHNSSDDLMDFRHRGAIEGPWAGCEQLSGDHIMNDGSIGTYMFFCTNGDNSSFREVGAILQGRSQI